MTLVVIASSPALFDNSVRQAVFARQLIDGIQRLAKLNLERITMHTINRFAKTGLLVMCALCAVAASAADINIVGTWRLLSWVAQDQESGALVDVFGANPTGYLIYTPGGRVTVNLTAEGRKPLSGDRFSSPVEERALAFSTSIAYSGTYTVKGDAVTHRVEVASFPNWVGTEQVRFVLVDGDKLTMKTPPIAGPPDGRQKVMTLVLKRLE